MNIDGLLHMLCTMYRWCVAALSSGLWNIPTPVDQVLDGRVKLNEHRRIAAHVVHNVSAVCRCFEQWSVEHSHSRRPGSGRPREAE